MLLTIICTPDAGSDTPATDLGFLLHKNPDRVQEFGLSYGTAHVLYPQATPDRCTAALLLEVDPVRLVRGRSREAQAFSLGQYGSSTGPSTCVRKICVGCDLADSAGNGRWRCANTLWG